MINNLIKNLDTKYEKWYNNIINKAKLREEFSESYYEVHHILPKSLGGSNDESNLVKLTLKEHIVVHKLLQKMYPKSSQMAFAVRMMTVDNKNRTVTGLLSTAEIEYYKKLAIDFKRGSKMPESFCKRISECNKNRVWKESSKQKLSNSLKGKKKSKEHISHMPNLWKKGNIPWNKGLSMSEDLKKKLSEKRKILMSDESKRLELSKKLIGNSNSIKKPVIDSKGVEYISTEACAKAYGVCSGTIRFWIRKHPEKGFKFK